MVSPIPEGYPRVTPYLIVHDGAAAIDYYTSVLGATERMRMGGPEGKVGHAELGIGDSVIMLADEHPEMGARGPKTVGGTPVSMHVYVEDADRVFESAIEAGATSLQPMEDKFYGDRSGSFEDPFGHHWKRAAQAAASG
jgi:PhnB protein